MLIIVPIVTLPILKNSSEQPIVNLVEIKPSLISEKPIIIVDLQRFETLQIQENISFLHHFSLTNEKTI